MSRLGFSLDNVDVPSHESYQKLVAAKAQVIGTLWTNGTRHRRNVYEQLEYALDKPHYTLRIGPSQIVPVSVWLADARDAVNEVPLQIIADGRLSLRHFNEGNLTNEGDWKPREYANHYKECANYVRRNWHPIKMGPMPVSLGINGWKEWYGEFVNAGGLALADFVSVNCYAHLIGEIDYFLGLGKPVRVTEFNTLDLQERPHWLLRIYNFFKDRGVESAEIFISGGKSYGGWNEDYIIRLDECQVLGQRPVESTSEGAVEFYPAAERTLLTRNFTPGGMQPKIIALHGTSGLGDPFHWWNRVVAPGEAASADFWIPRAGPRIKQYVKLTDTSWSNGPLVKPDLSVPFLRWLVEYVKTHPGITGNTWTVSLEFEKAPGNKSGLTAWQITEGRALIKWLSDTFVIPLDRTHVLGHNQFDSVSRAGCPGPMPWQDLLSNYAEQAETNFWAPMFNAANWARGKGRITSGQQIAIHELVRADKIASGVE